VTTLYPHEASDTLYSALATLPALESVRLSNSRNASALANPESLTELLRLPSLRSVAFDYFCFTPALCQATANALMEGTAVTKLELRFCSFSAPECASMMANGFSRNTSVSNIKASFDEQFDPTLYIALATALPSNSTLRDLSVGLQHQCCTPVVILFGFGKEHGTQVPTTRNVRFDGRVAVRNDAERARDE
jgi:hypothetical protein